MPQACHWILPRGTESWRARGSSPGSGLVARLPDNSGQWLLERRLLPVTVAGPHRHHTGFRVPHARRIVDANLDRRAILGKRTRDALLQLRASLLVLGAIGRH